MLFFIVKGTSSQDDKKGKPYYCNICYACLAHTDHYINIMGRSHRRTYVNPHGLSCELLTFDRCGEILEDDKAYMEHTWFDGYTWRIIACAG